MKVIKRDGRTVEFDKNKIIVAVEKAFREVDKTIEHGKQIARDIANYIEQQDKELTVESIQDIVEEKLMESDRKDVAKIYIIYRDKRTKARQMNSELMKKVWNKTMGTEIENSNANVDEKSFGGKKNEGSNTLQKELALTYLIRPEVSKAHRDSYIYQHDLSEYTIGDHNCLNLDFGNIFKNGFGTRNGDVRPPKSFNSACQLVAVAFQCQSQVQFGGVGSVHIDYDLAPFVRMSFEKHFYNALLKEFMREQQISRLSFDDDDAFRSWKKEKIKELKEKVEQEVGHIELDNEKAKELYSFCFASAVFDLEEEGQQATQGLYHNLNTLESRQGSQVPFTSINLGRDTSTEGRMVTRWLMQASIEGIGKHHLTSIFPISIFQHKDGVNAKPGDKNYDLKQLALKSMSKRIYPNWVNGDWSQAHEDPNNPDTYFSTMGCRTLVGYDRHGLGYIRTGRGNNVPITMILPKLGIEYGICLGERTEPDMEGFWNKFEEVLKLTETALIDRFQYMCKQPPSSAPFMYNNGTIKDADKCVDNVYESLKHNTLAIGYIGIAEMCQALFGENHVHNPKIHEFALKVVKRISDYADECSERHDLNFSAYATPAEGLCSTALENLKQQYGVIPNITDRDYLTNSHHVPVWEKISIYDKLKVEAPFCKYPKGGCITYIELESTFLNNIKAVEDIIDYAFKELDIPYLAFNFPIDSCLECGYQGEFNNACSQCGSTNIQQLRRVTGYLTTDYHNFNKGKQSEVLDRVKHTAYTSYENA